MSPTDAPLPHVEVDPGGGRLPLVYDGDHPSPEAAAVLADDLANAVGGTCACLFRVERSGGRSCESCAAATLGVAMGGAGTDVALVTADVVLMADDLSKIPYLLRLSHRTRRTLAVHIAISLGAIVAMVATILVGGLPLPLAVVGHEGSTVVVSLDGLRLLAARDRA